MVNALMQTFQKRFLAPYLYRNSLIRIKAGEHRGHFEQRPRRAGAQQDGSAAALQHPYAGDHLILAFEDSTLSDQPERFSVPVSMNRIPGWLRW